MDCLVIGGDWTGAWLSSRLARAGAKVACWTMSESSPDDYIASFVGTGEIKERVGKTFGHLVTEQLWSLSQQNQWLVCDVVAALGDRSTSATAVWLDSSGGEMETSPACIVQAREIAISLQKAGQASGAKFQRVSSITSIEPEGVLGLKIHAVDASNKPISLSVSAIFIAAENFPRKLFAGLESIWLPVTLNRFRQQPAPARHYRRASLFHGGMDFAIENAGQLIVGSYRNLFEDKAYGIRPGWVDPAAERAVCAFFHERGFAARPEAITSYTRYASLSCDGLPLVGPLPAYPGVFVVSGFSGREENFFFECSRRLAESFVRGTPDPALDLLSPKRLL